MLIDIAQLLIFGIVFGSILTLGAIGVSLIFGIILLACEVCCVGGPDSLRKRSPIAQESM